MTQEEINNYKIDRTGWPSGEWDNEPDRLDFIHQGLACMMIRTPPGHWCGYVGVPDTHVGFKKPYDDIVDVEVHGGLTYGAPCAGHICHVPAPGMPDNVWWFGFDCTHLGDISPGMFKYRTSEFYHMSHEYYRNVEYVKTEVISLADQLAVLRRAR